MKLLALLLLAVAAPILTAPTTIDKAGMDTPERSLTRNELNLQLAVSEEIEAFNAYRDQVKAGANIDPAVQQRVIDADNAAQALRVAIARDATVPAQERVYSLSSSLFGAKYVLAGKSTFRLYGRKMSQKEIREELEAEVELYHSILDPICAEDPNLKDCPEPKSQMTFAGTIRTEP